ncbi:hypothetical protein [Ekhidna sp.]
MKSLTTKNLFLIDGIGAAVSALFLGIVLTTLNDYIGMPLDVLYILAGLATLFATYSISCYFISPSNSCFYLKIIAYVNISYCMLTCILAYLHYKSLMTLGWIYFVGEVLIIITIVRLELKEAYK